jgi:cell wall-associated NlpC family hydrolase
MRVFPLTGPAIALLLCAGALFPRAAAADEERAAQAPALEVQAEQPLTRRAQLMARANALVSEAGNDAQNLLDGALGLVGIRYRRGGTSAETGFDCSGFVGYVFLERLGLKLPRTSREISQVGEKVEKSDLEPGDLVFFKTMRRAFSHVGIYVGDHLFVHAPKPGEAVRVEDMRQSYWAKRYEGARRVDSGSED